MNGTTTTPLMNEEASFPVRLSIAALYLLLTGVGLGGYAVVLRGIRCDYKQEYKKKRFYILIYHLAIGDIGMLFAGLIMTPLVLTGQPLYGQGYFHNALGFFNSGSFYLIFYISLLIALNRMCMFILPRGHGMLTDVFGTHMWLTCMLPWLLSVVIYITTTYMGLLVVFNHAHMQWSYRVTQPISAIGLLFLQFLNYQLMLVPLAMFAMYAVTLCVLRFGERWRTTRQSDNQNDRRRAKREVGLLVQSVIICTVLEATCLLFIVSTMPAYNHGLLGGVFLHCFTTVNSSINPFIFLLFNHSVRVSVKKAFFGAKAAVVKVTPTGASAQPPASFQPIASVQP